MFLVFRSADDSASDCGSGDELLQQDARPSCSIRRIALASFVSIAVTGCLIIATSLYAGQEAKLNTSPQENDWSARMLLRSDDFVEAATDNIMRAARKVYTSSDRPRVRALVDTAILNMDTKLDNDLDLATHFDELKLPQEHREEILQSVRYLTDPRVQLIGLKVAHAVRSCPTEDPSDVKRHVLEQLLPHLEEVKRLSQEIYPKSQTTFHKAAGVQGWDTDFSAERVRLLKTFDDKWDAHLDAAIQESTQHAALRKLQVSQSTTNAPMVKSEEALGIAMAVMDQARALIDILRPMAKIFGHDLNMNVWATTGIGAGDAVFHLISCVLDGIVDGYNMVELVSCPMQVGTEGMDAIRGLLSTFGILGDNIPGNGHTGAHNGSENDQNVGKETTQDTLNR